MSNNITYPKVFGNEINYLTWHEFWYPNKAAEIEYEKMFNAQLLAANERQNKMEAETTMRLSELQAKYKQQRLEQLKSFKDIIIAGVAMAIIGVTIYFLYKK